MPRFPRHFATRCLTIGCPGAILLLLTAVGTLAAQSAPRPDPATARLMARLSALAADSMEGRRAGSPGGARARRWIIQELQAIGVEPIDGRYDMPVRLRGRAAGADTLGANIVARIPGRRREGPVLVLSAHYDHLGVRNGVVYNGADDDASGCVALLAIAERLRAEPPEHDVLLAFFDAEESGLVGARAFVAAPPVPIERVAANLNLDMVARQDGGALWVAGTAHYPQLRPAAEAAAANARIKIRFGHDTPSTKPGDDWTNSSDHGPFHAQRIPFLYLGVEDHADYHQPGDKAAKVDPTFYSAVVDFAHALTRQLDQRLAQFKR